MANNSVYDPSNPIHIYASDVVEQVKKDDKEAAYDEEFGSVIIVLAIISITISVIRFIWDCRHAHEIPPTCHNPGLFEKITVQREVRKHLSREMYKKYGAAIIDAMFKCGEKTEVETIQKMYDLAKN